MRFNVEVGGTVVVRHEMGPELARALGRIEDNIEQLRKEQKKMDTEIQSAIDDLKSGVNDALAQLKTDLATDIEEIIKRNVTNPAEVTAAVSEAKQAIIDGIKTVDALPGFPEAPAGGRHKGKKS